MKTLDEVIIALEVCTYGYCSHPKHGDCPYLDDRNDCDTRQRKLDALHYLKVLQKMQKAQPVTKGEWDELYNSPLTWDELRTMKGKPVWVEPCKEWMLITEIETEPHIWLLSLDGLDYDMSLHEWQAYRKER